MTATEDLSIISLVMHASLLVKLVMGLLVAISFMSWYWIFRKFFAIRDARSRTDKFELEFWSGGDLNALFQSAANDRHNAGGMERIFEAGYREFTKLRARPNMDTATVVDGARRAMRATYQRELDELESAIAAGVTINLESEGEADRALGIAARLGRIPRLAVRVNPDFLQLFSMICLDFY